MLSPWITTTPRSPLTTAYPYTTTLDPWASLTPANIQDPLAPFPSTLATPLGYPLAPFQNRYGVTARAPHHSMLRQLDDTMNTLMGNTMNTMNALMGNVMGGNFPQRAGGPIGALTGWVPEDKNLKMTFAVPTGLGLTASLDPSGRVVTLSGDGQDAEGTHWSYKRSMTLPFEIADADTIQMETKKDVGGQTTFVISVPNSSTIAGTEPRRIPIKKSDKKSEGDDDF